MYSHRSHSFWHAKGTVLSVEAALDLYVSSHSYNIWRTVMCCGSVHTYKIDVCIKQINDINLKTIFGSFTFKTLHFPYVNAECVLCMCKWMDWVIVVAFYGTYAQSLCTAGTHWENYIHTESTVKKSYLFVVRFLHPFFFFVRRLSRAIAREGEKKKLQMKFIWFKCETTN